MVSFHLLTPAPYISFRMGGVPPCMLHTRRRRDGGIFGRLHRERWPEQHHLPVSRAKDSLDKGKAMSFTSRFCTRPAVKRGSFAVPAQIRASAVRDWTTVLAHGHQSLFCCMLYEDKQGKAIMQPRPLYRRSAIDETHIPRVRFSRLRSTCRDLTDNSLTSLPVEIFEPIFQTLEEVEIL